jgi:hypothetical protein
MSAHESDTHRGEGGRGKKSATAGDLSASAPVDDGRFEENGDPDQPDSDAGDLSSTNGDTENGDLDEAGPERHRIGEDRRPARRDRLQGQVHEDDRPVDLSQADHEKDADVCAGRESQVSASGKDHDDHGQGRTVSARGQAS